MLLGCVLTICLMKRLSLRKLQVAGFVLMAVLFAVMAVLLFDGGDDNGMAMVTKRAVVRVRLMVGTQKEVVRATEQATLQLSRRRAGSRQRSTETVRFYERTPRQTMGTEKAGAAFRRPMPKRKRSTSAAST